MDNHISSYQASFSERSALLPSTLFLPGWFIPLHAWLGPRGRSVVTFFRLSQDGSCTGAAFERWSWRQGCLFPLSVSWMSIFDYSGLPLLPPSDPEEALAQALEKTFSAHRSWGVLLRLFPDTAQIHTLLSRVGARLKVSVTRLSSHERAAFFIRPDFEAWYQKTFSAKRRKEFKRLRKKLEEKGTLTFSALGPEEEVGPWLEAFLTLEAKGWKGKRGTALACSDAMVGFLQDAIPSLVASKNCLFWKLSLDDRPLAMAFALVFKDEAHLIKIAYDEDFARYSPGVLCVLDITRDLCARPSLKVCDSCALPNHPMINHIWYDRLRVCDVLLTAPKVPAPLAALVVGLERGRRAVRGFLKTLYLTVRHCFSK